MKNTLLIGSLAIFATTSVSTATILFIDDFTEGTFSLSETNLGSGVSSETGLDASKTIGGARQSRAHVTDNTNIGTSFNNFNNSGDAASWSLGDGVEGHFHLYYGTANVDNPFELNANFSSQQGIEIRVNSADVPGPIDVLLTTAGTSNVYEASYNVVFGVDGYTLQQDFANFTQISGTATPLDLTDIDGITVETGDNLALADWNIDFVSTFETITVPEPSSTALLGLGGLALMLRRRR
jgi:hypothetical protein